MLSLCTDFLLLVVVLCGLKLDARSGGPYKADVSRFPAFMHCFCLAAALHFRASSVLLLYEVLVPVSAAMCLAYHLVNFVHRDRCQVLVFVMLGHLLHVSGDISVNTWDSIRMCCPGPPLCPVLCCTPFTVLIYKLGLFSITHRWYFCRRFETQRTPQRGSNRLQHLTNKSSDFACNCKKYPFLQLFIR